MEPGPFDKINKMVDGRRSIRESITQQISYASFDENDFGFPLTAAAKLKITNIAQHTIDEMSHILKNIDDEFLSALQQKIQSTENIQKKLKLLKLGQKSISSFNVDTVSLQQWMDQFKSSNRTFNITSIDMDSTGSSEK